MRTTLKIVLPLIVSVATVSALNTRLASGHYCGAELLHPPPSLSKSINFLTAILFPFFAAALSNTRACAQFFGTLSPCTYISARATAAEISPLATPAQSNCTVSALSSVTTFGRMASGCDLALLLPFFIAPCVPEGNSPVAEGCEVCAGATMCPGTVVDKGPKTDFFTTPLSCSL